MQNKPKTMFTFTDKLQGSSQANVYNLREKYLKKVSSYEGIDKLHMHTNTDDDTCAGDTVNRNIFL